MALVVETGAGVAGANSYTALVDAQAFIDARGLSSTLTEGWLLLAMDHLNALRFAGYKADAANPLPFPRRDLTDMEGNLVSSTAVPDGVVSAQVWIAYYMEQGSDPSAVPTPAVIMEKVDVIEVEYAAPSGATTGVDVMSLPNVRAALRGLTLSEELERA